MFTQGRIRVIALVLADMAGVAAVWALVVWGYHVAGLGQYQPLAYLRFWPVMLFFAGVNAALDLYHGNWMYPAAPLSPVEEMRRLVVSALVAHAGVIAYLAFAYQTTVGVSRFVVAISGVVTAFGAQTVRDLARAAMHWSGVGQIPVVLAGGGDAAKSVAASVAGDPYLGMRIVGYCEGVRRLGRCRRRARWDDGFFESLGIRYLGPLRDVVPEARKRDIKILLACQDPRLFRLQLDEFTKWFTYIEYMPTAEAFPIFGAKAIIFGGVGGIEMVNQARMRVKRLQKRILDMALAAFAFAALSPLFVVIPVLIKLTSRGPVFYRHRRLGKGGREIFVWKFRSMYADADDRLRRLLESSPAAAKEWRESFKLKGDPRVTPLGRILRSTSLDELPQFFNVFSGEMALIGPRPIVKEEVARYGASYGVFSSVRPGITGLWQVSGRSDTGYARRVALDCHYVRNWSPWMDVWILLRTVRAVLLMRGAR